MSDFDLFREPRLADVIEEQVVRAVLAHQTHAKNMCMSVGDFLDQLKQGASRYKADATVIAEFDELNDMLLVHLADDENKETFAVAVPRTPADDVEELVLDTVKTSESLEAFEKALRSLLGEKELREPTESDKVELEVTEDMAEKADIADDEIEIMASRLESLTSIANNVHEAYMIELAAERLRSLKGE